jgi:multiple sugar transport system ATP-binding protein
MNFFDVTLVNGTLRGDDFEYSIGPEIKSAVGNTTELVLGIRPEDIELAERAAGDHDFETVVDVVEPMGDENTVHLQFGEGGTSIIATVGGFTQVATDDSVVVRIPEDAIHVFDRESGEALHNRSLESDTLSVALD